MSTGEGSHWLTASVVAAAQSGEVVPAQALRGRRASVGSCRAIRYRTASRALDGSGSMWAEGKEGWCNKL